MLSDLIHSRHSYRAVQLALEPVHQRSVHSGPLVTSSNQIILIKTIPLFLGAQTISSPFSNIKIRTKGWHITDIRCHFLRNDSSYISLSVGLKPRISRYGVNLTCFNRLDDFPRYSPLRAFL